MSILDRLSKREKTIAQAITVIIILSLIYGFLIEPLFKRWNDINRETKLTKLKLQKALSIIKNKPEIDREYALYVDKLKSKASDEEEITFILNEIETIARSSQSKLISMRPKPVADKDYYKRYMVEIETESDMNSLMKFIYDIKESSQLLKIERLNINTKSSQQGVIIRASMVISKVAIR